MFLKGKQEADGYPENVKTEEEKEKYIKDYYDREGVQLDADKMLFLYLNDREVCLINQFKKMNVEIHKNNQQLELSFKFNKIIIEKIKSIRGTKFNGIKKQWSVPIELEDELLSIFRQSQISYDFFEKQDEQKSNENKGVISILNQDDFTVKLPIPKPLWSKLSVIRRIASTEKDWTFSKEFFMDFQRICLELYIGVIFKV
ncbi:unnamed protein product [Brachionus calyciflorus]|uniref:Uncharacterized protein n=1 Tax=Brachionus calyciflorus TaxID=104777 RepID=A0A814QFB6_9BILA|nr:unnamed protein product [Brachionus calyciflorus]